MARNKSKKVQLTTGDGGISFQVVDEGYGPTLVLHSSQWGNITTETKIHTTVESLRALQQMFEEAAHKDYSEEYVYPARVHDLTASNGVGHTGSDDSDHEELVSKV